LDHAGVADNRLVRARVQTVRPSQPVWLRTVKSLLGLLVWMLLMSVAVASAQESPESAAPSSEADSSASEAPASESERLYNMDTDRLPTLGDRKITREPKSDEERTIWPHMLPFFAQDTIDQGFKLPNPYGAAGIFYMQRQDAIVEDLEVSINGGPSVPLDFISIGTASVTNVIGQMKLDAWLFPFMNVYVTGGYVGGSVEVPLSVKGQDLLEFLGLDALCTGGPAQPAICTRSITQLIKPDYQGGNITAGTVLAVGWRQFFAMTNFSYTWSWIDIVDTTVSAIYFSPRVGLTGDMGGLGSVQAYVGAGFLLTDIRLAGTMTFDTSGSGIPNMPNQTRVDFKLRQKNKDRWNFLVGMNWDLKRWLSVQAEAGFGGSRSNVIISSTYRF
jgi:hypothetical protein